MEKKITKVAITGARGRMGKLLIKEIQKNKYIHLQYALINNMNQSDNTINNKKILANHTKLFTTLNNLKKKKYILDFDTLIDFSEPQSTLKMIKYCVENKKNIIIGTTGFNDTQITQIHEASKKIPILFSANFSIGINIIHNILKYISPILGNQADIEIIESHHRNKKDAPSGTALQLGKVISHTMQWDFKKSAIFSRYGNTGVRKKRKIGFSSIREGNTIGEHTILFSNRHEKISITHTATCRSTFAKGALKAAIWIHKKKKGLYSMSDVLKDNSSL
ncbi:4-hydroxy-tetrahydrodipicolinate reductase [Buchnera aphidicola]|uniref:4-hydroxy-tetrahydrodipicolinate reductase n=1 Tax=Buchnera aphidicola TaxID=9 RepID=UPI00094CD43B|nr:4-hydroxy-tetrahydrodipicolinate reductase [Buchnera aphidicola]